VPLESGTYASLSNLLPWLRAIGRDANHPTQKVCPHSENVDPIPDARSPVGLVQGSIGTGFGSSPTKTRTSSNVWGVFCPESLFLQHLTARLRSSRLITTEFEIIPENVVSMSLLWPTRLARARTRCRRKDQCERVRYDQVPEIGKVMTKDGKDPMSRVNGFKTHLGPQDQRTGF
jgi:hypothetical protein